MEGDAAYKFSTLNRYLEIRGLPPVFRSVDIGAGCGDTIFQLLEYFPLTCVHAYEGYEKNAKDASETIRKAEENGTLRTGRVQLFVEAVTGQTGKMTVYHTPANYGGNIIAPSPVDPNLGKPLDPDQFIPQSQEVKTVTLTEVIERMGEIDFMEMDCEGCEHSSLRTCPVESLMRVRFISGEYHGLFTFWRSTEHTLRKTHRLELCGDGNIGCFFAARFGDEQDILSEDEVVYPSDPTSGVLNHPFRYEYINPGDEWMHCLPERRLYDEWLSKYRNPK